MAQRDRWHHFCSVRMQVQSLTRHSELKDPALLQQLGSDPWPKNSKLHLLQGPAAKKREEEKKKKSSPDSRTARQPPSSLLVSQNCLSVWEILHTCAQTHTPLGIRSRNPKDKASWFSALADIMPAASPEDTLTAPHHL